MTTKEKIKFMEERQRLFEEMSTHYINLAYKCLKAVEVLERQEKQEPIETAFRTMSIN
jgi:hypothetical protein